MSMMNFPRPRGRSVPAPPLAWLAGIAVNQVQAISGTSGAGGAPVNAFSGWAWRPDTKELYIGGCGGHQDSGDNRVVSLNLGVDSPAWVLRKAATDPSQYNLGQPHGLDGNPTAVHTYNWGNRWIPEQGRLMRFGAYAAYDTVNGYPNVDGFLPIGSNGGAWDAAGTYAAPPAGWYGNAKRGTNGGVGDVYAIWGAAGGVSRKWAAATATWSTFTPTNLQSTVIYYPWAYNSNADYLFGLCRGDGSGSAGSTSAIKFDPVANRQDAITFNSSAGYDAWVAENLKDAAMEFNPVDGKFYWWAGVNIYVITPNAGLVWDMAVFTPSGSIPATISAGVQNRFTWADFGTAKGFLLLPQSSANVHFLRMA